MKLKKENTNIANLSWRNITSKGNIVSPPSSTSDRYKRNDAIWAKTTKRDYMSIKWSSTMMCKSWDIQALENCNQHCKQKMVTNNHSQLWGWPCWPYANGLRPCAKFGWSRETDRAHCQTSLIDLRKHWLLTPFIILCWVFNQRTWLRKISSECIGLIFQGTHGPFVQRKGVKEEYPLTILRSIFSRVKNIIMGVVFLTQFITQDIECLPHPNKVISSTVWSTRD